MDGSLIQFIYISNQCLVTALLDLPSVQVLVRSYPRLPNIADTLTSTAILFLLLLK